MTERGARARASLVPSPSLATLHSGQVLGTSKVPRRRTRWKNVSSVGSAERFSRVTSRRRGDEAGRSFPPFASGLRKRAGDAPVFSHGQNDYRSHDVNGGVQDGGGAEERRRKVVMRARGHAWLVNESTNLPTYLPPFASPGGRWWQWWCGGLGGSRRALRGG